MNQRIVSATLAALLAFGGFASAQSMVKIGTVDMKKIFDGYYKTKEAEQRINEARSAATKELSERTETFKKLAAEVKKLDEEVGNAALSKESKGKKAADRDQKIGELKNMDREINEFRVTREKQLQEQSARMRAGIVEEINNVVQDQVKAENYDVVLDKSGTSLNNVPLVMFAKDSFDFTDAVVTILNKNKGAEPASTPAATPSPKPAQAATPRVKKPTP